MSHVEITEQIKYIGADDKDIELFIYNIFRNNNIFSY